MVVIFPIYPVYPMYPQINPHNGLFIYPKQPRGAPPPPKKTSASPPRRRAPNADLRWAGREWSFHQKLKTIKREWYIYLHENHKNQPNV